MDNTTATDTNNSLTEELLGFVPPTLGQRLGVEFLGTFWLVLGGCGSAVLAAAFPHVGIGLLGVSLAFGLTVLSMAFAFGHISGGHFNPAVTVGLWLAGRQGPRYVLPYIGAQVVGGIVGAGVLYVIASGNPAYSLATNGLAANGYGAGSPGNFSLTAALVTEVIMTMLFLFIILGATDRRAAKGFGPLAIGLALTLIHLISIPVTNTSVNPARSTGPALFVGGLALGQLWLFWVAPLVGAALAGFSYRFLTGAEGLEPVAAQGQRISQATTSIGDVTSSRPLPEL
ncbi:aquaporin Z [Hymenobacter sp. HMF4947]|uniref:Aquaporin Z n=1 Tax=Hymenobacter ginkgonis TaxID=2682976 RepID=A0A7K1THH9_9BACT|nr:aquaporin Z [Hymenobacter ginkgonis]MVN77868.1 aquaporin Z [Hymenobacter ginkgonis]